MPILTVANWCRSSHPIEIEGVLLSKEYRKALAAIDAEEEIEIVEEEAMVDGCVKPIKKSQKRIMSKEARARVILEQSRKPTLEYLTDPVSGIQLERRVPLSRVIDKVHRGLTEAAIRLPRLKVHVEIYLQGDDVIHIQRMIERGEHLVHTLHT